MSILPTWFLRESEASHAGLFLFFETFYFLFLPILASHIYIFVVKCLLLCDFSAFFAR